MRISNDLHFAVAMILVLCIILVFIAYMLGIETGKASILAAHPGCEHKTIKKIDTVITP